MLLVPEGVCACFKGCRVGVAVSSLATDEASHSCSVCSLFRVTSIRRLAFGDAWHKISLSGEPCGLYSVCSLRYLYTSRVSPQTQQHTVEADSGRALIQICFVIIGTLMDPLFISSACPTASHQAAAALHMWQTVEKVREAFHR